MTIHKNGKYVSPGLWLRCSVLVLLMGVTSTAMINEPEEPKEMEREISVSATFTNLAEDLLLIDAGSHSVTLRFSGPSATLNKIDPGQIACTVDLSGRKAGIHRVPINPDDIDLPEGVSVKALVTPELMIQLETASMKLVDVVAALKGKPAPGYTVENVTVVPGRIKIKGTATILDEIDTVNTRTVDLANASDDFKKEVPLLLPEAIVVDPPLGIVVVHVEMTERIVTRVLKNVPVLGKGCAGGFRIEPADIDLTVRGPELIVQAIESDPDFSVTIDLAGLPAGSHMLSATIQLPIRTTLVEAHPDHFSVTIEK